MAKICLHCGDTQDTTAHGLRHNLGKRDQGQREGAGWCGAAHQFSDTRRIEAFQRRAPGAASLRLGSTDGTEIGCG